MQGFLSHHESLDFLEVSEPGSDMNRIVFKALRRWYVENRSEWLWKGQV